MCDIFHALFLLCTWLFCLFYSVLSLFSLYCREQRPHLCDKCSWCTFWWSKVCRYVFNTGVENWVTHRLMEKLHPAVALPPFSECRKWRRQQSCTKNRAAIPFVTDQSILNVNDFLKNCNSVCPVNWAGSFHICSQNNWCVHRAGFSS